MLLLLLLLLGEQQLQQQLRRLVSPEPRRVRIPHRFTVMRVAPDEYRLHSLTYSLAVRDDADGVVSGILEALDRPATVRELVTRLAPLPADGVVDAVASLLQAGALEAEPVVTEGALTPPERARMRPQINFLSHFTPPHDVPEQELGDAVARSGEEFQERIARSHVVVLGAGRLGSLVVRDLALAGVGRLTVADDAPVTGEDVHLGGWYEVDSVGRNRAQELCRRGTRLNPYVRLTPEVEPADGDPLADLLRPATLAVLVTDRPRPSRYAAVNAAALVTGTSWTSGRLVGFEFQLGPTVLPRETACWTCADLRLQSNLPDLGEARMVERYLERADLRTESLTTSPGPSLVAMEALRVLAGFTVPVGYDALFTLDLVTLAARRHPVLKLPRCPACGRPGQPRPTVHAWQQGEAPVLLR